MYEVNWRGNNFNSKGVSNHLRVHVVCPDGVIKTVRISPTTHSMLVTFEPITAQSGRVVGIMSVSISPWAHRNGYRLLSDMFEAEGIADGLERYRQFELALERTSGDERKAVAAKDWQYLPKAVLAMRKTKSGAAVKLPEPIHSGKDKLA